ncbi:MAG: hypothetical protein LV479_12450 [Methylacidiphilales bacterium]|nr:hypothetical protein [Candidatus Methylacidiphilales bacterium]
MDDALREWLLEHCQEAYDYQLTRSENIAGRLSLLSGLLTALGGGIYYVGTSYPHAWNGLMSLCFYLPFAISALLFCYSVILYLVALARGFSYSYVPTSPAIIQYAHNLEAFNASNPDQAVPILTDIKESLIKQYSNAELSNFQTNSSRTAILLRAAQLSAISLVFVALSLPYFLYEKNACGDNPSKVMIINPVKVSP